MLQKVATALYIAIQCLFIACALIVVTAESSVAPTTLVGAATFMVAYYALGSALRKIFDVWMTYCRRAPGKGMMDL